MEDCPRCGKQIYSEDLFCGACGISLLARNSTAAATQKDLKLLDIQLSLGIVYFKKQEFEKAVDCFRKVLNADPKNISAQKLIQQAAAVCHVA